MILERFLGSVALCSTSAALVLYSCQYSISTDQSSTSAVQVQAHAPVEYPCSTGTVLVQYQCSTSAVPVEDQCS